MEVVLERGRIIEGYVVDSVLARSPTATVWRVEHAQRRSAHALKVLHHADARRRARLEHELVLGHVLQHRNVVSCTQVVEVQQHAGMILDLVDGPSLDLWLHDDPPDDLGTRLRIFRSLLDGVAHVHGRGVVHRNLKPSNVLLASAFSRDRMELLAKITDFGLAKTTNPAIADALGLTDPGSGLGTWGYAAPEQIRDASAVDRRADLYSLGCILYELVCGVPPFAGLRQSDAFQAQREGRYPAPRSLVPGLPERLYGLMDVLLSPDPAKRPQSVEEVIARIDVIALEPVPGTTPAAPLRASQPAPTPSAARQGVERFEVSALLAICAIPLAALLVGAVAVLRS